MHQVSEINKAKEFVQSKTTEKPTVGIILGSGLGSFADTLEDAVHIPYHTIPYFAASGAVGHANELVIGKIAGKTVVAMKGRFHYYEGVSLDEVTFPVRVMKALGVEKLIITNACGAVNTEFNPGDLMLITDHINLTANNPLIGPNNPDLGVRFLDVSQVYNKTMRQIVIDTAKEQDITLRQGVYAWWTGPTYETPAEIRMIRTLGADAVGMSTVPEALIARHSGIDTIGISCLTNMACGILEQPLSHDEVIETAERVKSTFLKLISEVIARL
ncbi:purine-nucleoside phosphorylase [Proteus vulgaris]|jgi:purine-nucleoside phosphorylase|uniref:purine-nucleoside phosphorylase n=1 Tax=Proteus TaxID=583 RepID=UPI000C9FC7BB|nr:MULTISPECIES: purine-nucleoside phosphorylase [Proteus]MBG5984458.1 purine-nucleoside phosphorylase [Proteus vulgaris]MBW3471347.1 purine-nucleoside phosphorylase [Proteus vulgaris]MCH4254419.1 purine-nucleoside phosphorylase [Proteus vulgaris]NBN74219.1 purine-nucleoside phosphorylase [Proteus sp. G2615]NBN84801.1 purine-nucleoside phosphorylase [Proteus sp. G2300]